MATWITVIFTGFIVIFTYLVWKVYERMAWLTGAMATHSNLMLRIEALRGINHEPIKLIWWDFSIGDPPRKDEHGQEVDVSTVYIGLPLKKRKNRKKTWAKLKELFSLPEG